LAKTEHLAQLIAIFLQGLQHPHAFFTESSFAYIKQGLKLKQSRRTTKPAMLMAEEMLQKEILYDANMRQLYQNIEPVTEILNADFEALCQQLLLPVWEQLQ